MHLHYFCNRLLFGDDGNFFEENNVKKKIRYFPLKSFGQSVNIFSLGENFLMICFVSLEIQ